MNRIPIVELRHVTKNFEGVRALDDVTLLFHAGTVTSIVGSNGAGKTTVLNTANGLCAADSGLVLLDGKRVNGLPAFQLARLGIGRLFQDSRVFSDMTALDNVMVGRAPGTLKLLWTSLFWPWLDRGSEAVNRADALECLQFVGLEKEAWRCAGNLSYGQQKLLAVARLLHSGARCMLLDEPTAGLRTEAVHDILNLLQKIARTGKAVVMVEHNIDAVGRISDFLYLLCDGHVRESGPANRVLGALSRINGASVSTAVVSP